MTEKKVSPLTKAARKRLSDKFESQWNKTHKKKQNKHGEKR